MHGSLPHSSSRSSPQLPSGLRQTIAASWEDWKALGPFNVIVDGFGTINLPSLLAFVTRRVLLYRGEIDGLGRPPPRQTVAGSKKSTFRPTQHPRSPTARAQPPPTSLSPQRPQITDIATSSFTLLPRARNPWLPQLQYSSA